MTEPPFRLTAVDIAGLWSIQAGREQSLDDVARALFADADPHTSLALDEGRYLLRAWPHQAYLLTAEAGLPTAAKPCETLITDIADAYCAFNLEGAAAFDFIADYLSADIRDTAPGPQCLRCRLGHYNLLLWWQKRERLQILVERSLAHSFEGYIAQLALRRTDDQDEINRQG